ncbi:MAG: sulfotransferase, partial [Rivularia sp. (in: cyanobacteria)]
MLIKSNSKLFQTYKRFRSYLGRPKLVVQTKPVIISDENQTNNPIFLIGIHRSGTSLVRRIVNSHSNIACPPETFFLEHFAAMVRTQHTFAGFRGLGIEKSEALNEIRLWASRHHEAFRMAQGKKRWADKTPQYVGILPEIEEIFGTKTQYIMIFRHPLDVVYSIFQRGWKFGDYDPNLLV